MLSIHLDDVQVDKFEKMIPVQLAQPPWNYTKPLEKGIQVYYTDLSGTITRLLNFVEHVNNSACDSVVQSDLTV